MTPTPRPLRAGGAAALMAAVLLAGCSDEETTGTTSPSSAPTGQESTSSATDGSVISSAPPQDTATASSPDDAAATSSPATAAADDTTATTSAAPSAEAGTLTSADDSFTVRTPEGWEEALDLARENVDADQRDSIVLAAKDRERKDEFYTNVVITQEPYVGNLTSAVEQTAKQLAGKDGTYTILDPVDVDGNKAPGYTVVRTVGDTTVHQTQRWISHEGTLYSVTFSAVDSQAKATKDQLDDLLASWAWTD